MNHRPWRAGAALLLAGALLAGCSGGDDQSEPDPTNAAVAATVPQRTDTAGDWTVFAYMAADNNLEPEAISDLVQMGDATGTEFVVLLDRTPGYATDDLLGLGDFTDTVLLHVVDGQAELLQAPGELNTGDGGTLQSFIEVGLESYRNDKNALVIWDHGGSWKGAAWDDTDGEDNLTLAEIGLAMESGLANSGLEKFDLVGFDACLMATYEVATTVAPYADYLIASEEVEPGHGWDWSSLTTPTGGATTLELGQSIIDGFMAEAEAANETATTLSLVDLGQLGRLDAAAEELARAMTDQAPDQIGRVGYTRNHAVSFGKDPNPANDYFSVDLGAMADDFDDIPGMEDAAAELRDAVSSIVVASSNGPVMADATGIAAYFPPSFDVFKEEYNDVPFAAAWADVLNGYYGTAGSVATSDLPTFTDEDRLIEEGDVTDTVDGVDLVADVARGTGGNIISAVLSWGQVDIEDPNQVIWFGELNAAVQDDQVGGSYDWRYLSITDGTTESPAYAQLNVSGDGEVDRIVIPIVYVRGDEQAEGNLQLSLEGDTIVAETFYLQIGDGIAAVKPQAGDAFVPLVQHQDLTDFSVTWEPAIDGVLDARNELLQYTYGNLPDATAIMLGLGITDVQGGMDFVFYGTASPVLG